MHICLFNARMSFTIASLTLVAIQEQGPLIPFQIFTASRPASLFYQSHKGILQSFKLNNSYPIQNGSDFNIIAIFSSFLSFHFFLDP